MYSYSLYRETWLHFRGRVELVLQDNLLRTMELSSVAIEGVGLCGDSTRVGDRAFRSLVQLTLDILLKKKSDDCLASK